MSQGDGAASGVGAGPSTMLSATGSRGPPAAEMGGADRTPRAPLRSFPSSANEDSQQASADRARDDMSSLGAVGAGLGAESSALAGLGPGPADFGSSTMPPGLARRHAQQASVASSAESSGGSHSHQSSKQSRSGPAQAGGSALQQPGGGQRGRPGHPYRSESKASDGSFTRVGKGLEPKNCSFCLLAEFDIDKGSTLAYQYPEPTGHDAQ